MDARSIKIMHCYCGSPNCLARDEKTKQKSLIDLHIERVASELKQKIKDAQHLKDNPNGCPASNCECCGCDVCPEVDLSEC